MKRVRVLVVDDEENIRLLFKEELEEEDYEVETASNGMEALEKIKGLPFDVVVLDIKMPVMDGIQTLNAIKNINKDQPVILCSAYGEFKQGPVELGFGRIRRQVGGHAGTQRDDQGNTEPVSLSFPNRRRPAHGRHHKTLDMRGNMDYDYGYPGV
jgi:CheY-like chemotaxis protein